MLEKIKWNDFIKIISPQYYVLFVTSDGTNTNLTGISWFTIVSWDPPMVIISIRNSRYGYELVKKNPEFVVCFPSEEQIVPAEMCGRKSGRDVDKVAEGKFELLPAAKVKVPLIADSTACLECVLKNEVIAGDHVILLAEVVECHGDFNLAKHVYTTGYTEFYSLDYSGPESE
ncbi:MAG: hypothetical protein A2Y62_09380 [Candidatus Fischerbacteria bacterium RBG_13_37_8]|uniref:Flavin reductase like domain-containing protein n=1 Tax=Candidatus Fischerbacteria bacterium RBG_13_37_8 TaxID=1817863 RepID=A0A1F5VXB8_9BACT|nr:MAG: hypothetical protein A2Y62_09380 [Candidatus Fischerbacteria bacterium RBG_13_37_8]